jgi:hypothetical protein
MKTVYTIVILVGFILASCGTDNVVNSEYSSYDGQYLMGWWGGTNIYFDFDYDYEKDDKEYKEVKFRNSYIKIGEYMFHGTWRDTITHRGDSLRLFRSIYDGPVINTNEELVLQITFYFYLKVLSEFEMTIQNTANYAEGCRFWGSKVK